MARLHLPDRGPGKVFSLCLLLVGVAFAILFLALRALRYDNGPAGEMTVAMKYPEGTVRLRQDYDFFVRVTGTGQDKPALLKTAIVEVLDGPDGMVCTMLRPAPREVMNFAPSEYLFHVPLDAYPAEGAEGTVQIQCSFQRPGTYEVHFATAFWESAQGDEVFVSRVFTVVAR